MTVSTRVRNLGRRPTGRFGPAPPGQQLDGQLPTATRDLGDLVAVELLAPRGKARGRHYSASSKLNAVRKQIIDARDPRDDSDPFAS
ncbi:MAG: hypothetical protein AUI10_04065 [Actinobacteria bacterium 13_2_20CM_2_72_6]|nr:MAG: hypothetical protein AUI10_04065 [Actinobacteria bacterium 13_2_20CM_2_72_6]